MVLSLKTTEYIGLELALHCVKRCPRGKSVAVFCDSLRALTYLSTNDHKRSLSLHKENARWALIKASNSSCSLHPLHILEHAGIGFNEHAELLAELPPHRTLLLAPPGLRLFSSRKQEFSTITLTIPNSSMTTTRLSLQTKKSIARCSAGLTKLVNVGLTQARRLRINLRQTDTCHILSTGPETPEHLWYCFAHFTYTFDMERMFIDPASLRKWQDFLTTHGMFT